MRTKTLRFVGGCLALYLVLVSLMVLLMAGLRGWALGTLATPAAQRNWEAWREDVREGRDPQAASVQRRVPTSAEPPALVLLRDYFLTCLIGITGLTSLLYWLVIWLVVGASTSPTSEPAAAPSPRPGQRWRGRGACKG